MWKSGGTYRRTRPVHRQTACCVGLFPSGGRADGPAADTGPPSAAGRGRCTADCWAPRRAPSLQARRARMEGRLALCTCVSLWPWHAQQVQHNQCVLPAFTVEGGKSLLCGVGSQGVVRGRKRLSILEVGLPGRGNITAHCSSSAPNCWLADTLCKLIFHFSLFGMMTVFWITPN